MRTYTDRRGELTFVARIPSSAHDAKLNVRRDYRLQQARGQTGKEISERYNKAWELAHALRAGNRARQLMYKNANI